MARPGRGRGAYAITMDDDLRNCAKEVHRLFEHGRDGNYNLSLHL